MIIMKKSYQKFYKYDTLKELYFNEKTNKWVKRIDDRKGKSIGKSIGKNIGKNIKPVKNGFHMYDFNIEYSSNIEIQERMNLFLTKIIYKYVHFIDRNDNNILFDMDIIDFDKSVYVYFSYRNIITLLGINYYKNILKWLVEENYIIEVNKYNKYKDTLFTFKPTDKLLNIKYTLKLTETLRVYNSLVIYYKKIEKKLGEYKFLFNTMSSYNIDITKEQYIEIINKKYDINKHGDYELYLKRNMYKFDNIINYNGLNKYERVESFVVDTFSGRFHSIFTNIPSECRKYITEVKKNNKTIDTSIDLKQSQICILSKLLLNEIGTNSFTTDTNNNDMYLLFKEKYMLNSRKESKKYMFNLLFGKPYCENKQGGKWISKEHKEFKSMYPGAAEYIIKLKLTPNKLEKQWSILAQKLQELEVDIFFGIWLELKQNKIKFICIHDELIVNEQDSEKTLLIMKKHMDIKLKGVNFELVMNKK